VRILNAQTGRWLITSVNEHNHIIGDNSLINPIAVVLIELKQAVSQWQPGVQP